jgi:YVTN family beta-propeller protein
VAVIDTDPNSATFDTVVATIPVGAGASKIALTPDGNQAFVINQTDGTISVVDLNSDTVQGTVPIELANGNLTGADIAITPNGQLAYFTVPNQGAVYALEIDPYTPGGSVSQQLMPTAAYIAADPSAITISADGNTAYVTHEDNTVSVVNITPGVVNNPFQQVQFVTEINAGDFASPVGIPTGGIPYPIALTPDGTRAFVAHADGTIAVIDTADDKVVSSFTVSKNPTTSVLGISVDPTSTYAYVVTSDNKLTVLTIAPVASPSTVTTTSGVDFVDV